MNLWLRSTKDYKRKKEAWEMKAQDLNISLEHLQKWWKNLKDWYVKLLKKTSGQAVKTLTGRDRWVLQSLSFYQSKYISCYVLLCFIFMYVKNVSLYKHTFKNSNINTFIFGCNYQFF